MKLRYTLLLLCALLLPPLVACGTEPFVEESSPPENVAEPSDSLENVVEPLDSFKIAVESQPGRSVAVHWYYDEAIQTPYRNTPFEELVFQVETESALTGLADGTYDIAILPCVRGETPNFGAYEALPLMDEAIVFVHGKPTEPDTDYDLTLEQIRTVYGSSDAYYWDEAQTVPLIPSFWDESLAQPLASLFGITAAPEALLSIEGYDNPVQATYQMGLNGATLFPVYYSFLSGMVGINGVVISVDGVLPTAQTIADGTYPLGISYYAVYSANNPDAVRVASELQIIAQ